MGRTPSAPSNEQPASQFGEQLVMFDEVASSIKLPLRGGKPIIELQTGKTTFIVVCLKQHQILITVFGNPNGFALTATQFGNLIEVALTF
jgi:hypothetical protein